MVEINLPYDKKMITARIPDKILLGFSNQKLNIFQIHILRKKQSKNRWTILLEAFH